MSNEGVHRTALATPGLLKIPYWGKMETAPVLTSDMGGKTLLVLVHNFLLPEVSSGMKLN